MSQQISRREFLACVLGAAGAWAVGPARAAAPKRPNIVFILTDDQGWPESSVSMRPEIPQSSSAYFETPSMARLAEAGMRFSSGYAPAPICTPTRRSVLCGMTPARQRGTEFKSDNFIPADHLTIPKALKAVDPNYVCAHFGKWGENMLSTPEDSGYDESDGETGNATGGGMGGKGADRLPNIAPEPLDDPKLTLSLTQRALDFMERQTREARPFYLQISYYAVHLQIQYRADTLEKYRRKGEPERDCSQEFAAMLDELDQGIGQVLDKIDSLGIAGETYVFWSADNGGAPNNKNNPLYLEHLNGVQAAEGEADTGGDAAEPPASVRLPDNHPLRAAKQWLYEGGIRVPFVVRGPGIQPGSVCHHPVAQYDLLPTFVDLAGGEGPLPGEIDGGSLRPALHSAGQEAPQRALPGLVFHRPARGYSALRVGDMKLVVNWAKNKKLELFDVSRDIGEWNDLAGAMPEKASEMYRVLTDYLKAVNAEAPKDVEY